MLSLVRHELLPEVVRITIELEREVAYDDRQITKPPRLVVDLPNVTPAPEMEGAAITLGDRVVRRVHLLSQGASTTRVAVDLLTPTDYSIYALYNPFRLVIDVERRPGASAAAR